MWYLNLALNVLFDTALRPFAGVSPWPALIAASFMTSGIFVLLFNATSRPRAILRARNRLLARTLELLLFQHDLRVSLTACGRILAANVAYLGQLVLPIAVGLVPLVLIFVQFGCWFEHRPLHVGEATVLTVQLEPSRSVIDTIVELRLPEFVHQDSPPVRLPVRNEIAWRLIATRPGAGNVEVLVSDVPPEGKSLVIGPNLARVSPSRTSGGFVSQLFSPSEPPLAASSPIRRMEVFYPRRIVTLGLTEVHWLLAAIVFLMSFSLILGPLLGVRIA